METTKKHVDETFNKMKSLMKNTPKGVLVIGNHSMWSTENPDVLEHLKKEVKKIVKWDMNENFEVYESHDTGRGSLKMQTVYIEVWPPNEKTKKIIVKITPTTMKDDVRTIGKPTIQEYKFDS
jgi:hypothetical protein